MRTHHFSPPCSGPRTRRHGRRPNAPQQPPQHFNRIALTPAEARQRSECELRLRKREERRLGLEPAMPADAGTFELLRPLLGEQVEVGERGFERRGAEFAEAHLGRPQVALLDRSDEPAVSSALSGHERMLARPRRNPFAVVLAFRRTT